ncbi:MAG: preprotein translocase subunit SecG [Candidatus Aminicenantes bacterium]|nr:preprotein translocase subunit SecG [Candidatus Aminicenantes bacterium]
MTALITIVHVLICIILIVAVLLQSGKAADLAGAFGGGGSQTAFGPRSTATIMSKVTQVCAILFMVTSLSLWILSGTQGKSAVSGVEAPAKDAAAQTLPAAKPDDKAAAVTPPAKTETQPPAKTEEKPPSAPDKK